MSAGNNTEIWYMTLEFMEIEGLLNFAQQRYKFIFSIYPNSRFP